MTLQLPSSPSRGNLLLHSSSGGRDFSTGHWNCVNLKGKNVEPEELKEELPGSRMGTSTMMNEGGRDATRVLLICLFVLWCHVYPHEEN
jgi:hypothetical protein